MLVSHRRNHYSISLDHCYCFPYFFSYCYNYLLPVLAELNAGGCEAFPLSLIISLPALYDCPFNWFVFEKLLAGIANTKIHLSSLGRRKRRLKHTIADAIATSLISGKDEQMTRTDTAVDSAVPLADAQCMEAVEVIRAER
ncbi:hypothetical protein Bca101_025158 [Brassica carinata]